MRRLTVWFASTALLSTFCNCESLKFTQANKKKTATAGENVTFTWRYQLGPLEQGNAAEVTFGLWKNRRLSDNILVVKETEKGKIEVTQVPLSYHINRSYGGRIHWVGDFNQSCVAFQLIHVTKDDARDFACKIRVDITGEAPRQGTESTTLIVLDPPPTTRPPEKVKYDKVVREGEQLVLKCPRPTSGSVTFVWSRNNAQIRRSKNSSFEIENVRREDGGNYTCVAHYKLGNWTGAEISVDVQYPPTIELDSKRKTIYSPTNRTLYLECPAIGNPPPKHAWYLTPERVTDNDIIRSRQRELKVVLRDDADFSIYTCKVSNKLGSDIVEYIIRKESDKTATKEDMDLDEVSTGVENDDDMKLAMYLSIGAVLAVLLIGGIFVFRCLMKRCKKEDMEGHNSGPLSLSTLESRPNKRLLSRNVLDDMEEWGLLMEKIKIEKIIGRGAFGVVSKGYVLDLPGKPGWTLVAIKSTQGFSIFDIKPFYNTEDATEKERKDLMSELQVLKQIRPHPHVIRLYGCIVDSDYPMVVVEYVPHGDLLGYLRKSRGLHDMYYDDPEIQPRTNLTSQQLVTFAWEIADGMDFLSSNKIIHRDLAARNVLVGEGETCKITDFGMARDVQEEDIYQRTTESRLPVKWTAPEALFGTGAYTTQSDVWSFGIVLYEICTIGGKPYPGINMRDMPAMLSTGYRMPRPPHVDQELYTLMRSCWDENAICRPTFEYLRCALDKFKNELNREYINLRECIYENEEALMTQKKLQNQLAVTLPPEESALMQCQPLLSCA